MQIPKLKVLIEAGAVREVEVNHEAAGGWMVWITYASRTSERREVLERQRGGARGLRHPGRGGVRCWTTCAGN